MKSPSEIIAAEIGNNPALAHAILAALRGQGWEVVRSEEGKIKAQIANFRLGLLRPY